MGPFQFLLTLAFTASLVAGNPVGDSPDLKAMVEALRSDIAQLQRDVVRLQNDVESKDSENLLLMSEIKGLKANSTPQIFHCYREVEDWTTDGIIQFDACSGKS